MFDATEEIDGIDFDIFHEIRVHRMTGTLSVEYELSAWCRLIKLCGTLRFIPTKGMLENVRMVEFSLDENSELEVKLHADGGRESTTTWPAIRDAVGGICGAIFMIEVSDCDGKRRATDFADEGRWAALSASCLNNGRTGAICQR